MESEQYPLFSGVNLYANKSSLYNKIYLETEWTDNGTFSILYEVAKAICEHISQGKSYQKMKSKGYPIEDIMDMTGLSVEDIERLQESQ